MELAELWAAACGRACGGMTEYGHMPSGSGSWNGTEPSLPGIPGMPGMPGIPRGSMGMRGKPPAAAAACASKNAARWGANGIASGSGGNAGAAADDDDEDEDDEDGADDDDGAAAGSLARGKKSGLKSPSASMRSASDVKSPKPKFNGKFNPNGAWMWGRWADGADGAPTFAPVDGFAAVGADDDAIIF